MELWLLIVSSLLWAGSVTLVALGVNKYLKSRTLMNTQLLSATARGCKKTAIELLKDGQKRGRVETLTTDEAEELIKLSNELLEGEKQLYNKGAIRGSTGELEGIEANMEIIMAAIFFASSSFLIGLSGVLIALFKGGGNV